MRTAGIGIQLRRLGFIALMALGLCLGSGSPALAEETDPSTIATACTPVEQGPASSSEWSLPPTPGRSGQPY